MTDSDRKGHELPGLGDHHPVALGQLALGVHPEADDGALVCPRPHEVVLARHGEAEDGPWDCGGARGWEYPGGDIDDLDQASNTSCHHQVVVTRQESATCQ